MKFTLRQLEVFVAVAQQGERLPRRRGAVAVAVGDQHLARRAGQQFDCKLFDRAGKRLTLNALGRQLLPQAVALLDRGEEIENLLNGKTAFGSLDLGATLTIGNYLATLLIGAFMQRQPDCRVRLRAHTAQVVQQVAHYELDLGLIGGDCRHPDIGCNPGWRTNWWCSAPPASAGAAGRRRPGTADAGGLDPPRAGAPAPA